MNNFGEPILKVNNLNVEFANESSTFKAVNNLNFNLSEKETLAVVGESGSGKSVTALSIMQLLPYPIAFHSKDSSINFQGIELINLPKKELENIRGKRISMIFQEPMTSLNPFIKVGKQIMESIQVHNKSSNKEAKEKAIDLLRKVEIPNPEQKFSSFPHQLSGGQRQRVMIAMALSNNPEILIADEPTTALDVSIQAQILNLIKELTIKRNLAVIIITHDMGVIAEITNKVAIMRYGVIVEQGPTKEVLTNPQSSEGKSLIISVPPTNKKINRFTLISPEGKEITLNSANLTKNIIKTWGVRETSNRKILNFENVSKVFDDGSLLKKQDNKDMVKALNEVTFDVFEGETLGLVGESGSGKSTIAKIITGLIKPSSGKISYFNDQLYNDRNIYQPQYSRGQIQMIFQDPYSSLNPRFKVRDIISEPLKFYQKDLSQQELQSNIHDLIDIAGMSRQSLDRYPHEFSGGQRQRISIARALATRPRLLICDEPTSALDVSIQAQILNLLKDIQDELHLTMLFISHDLPVIRQMCNRIVVLKDGNVCEINDSESLFNQPQHSYTKQLINLMPKIESLV